MSVDDDVYHQSEPWHWCDALGNSPRSFLQCSLTRRTGGQAELIVGELMSDEDVMPGRDYYPSPDPEPNDDEVPAPTARVVLFSCQNARPTPFPLSMSKASHFHSRAILLLPHSLLLACHVAH